MYVLFKLPIFYIVCSKIGQIIKTSQVADIKEDDKRVLSQFLVIYAMLLIATIIM